MISLHVSPKSLCTADQFWTGSTMGNTRAESVSQLYFGQLSMSLTTSLLGLSKNSHLAHLQRHMSPWRHCRSVKHCAASGPWAFSPLPFSIRYLEIESSHDSIKLCEVHIAARLILGSIAALS